jgi:hypothetical protein
MSPTAGSMEDASCPMVKQTGAAARDSALPRGRRRNACCRSTPAQQLTRAGAQLARLILQARRLERGATWRFGCALGPKSKREAGAKPTVHAGKRLSHLCRLQQRLPADRLQQRLPADHGPLPRRCAARDAARRSRVLGGHRQARHAPRRSRDGRLGRRRRQSPRSRARQDAPWRRPCRCAARCSSRRDGRARGSGSRRARRQRSSWPRPRRSRRTGRRLAARRGRATRCPRSSGASGALLRPTATLPTSEGTLSTARLSSETWHHPRLPTDVQMLGTGPAPLFARQRQP